MIPSASNRVLSIDVLRILMRFVPVPGCITALWLRKNRVPHARRGFFAPIMGLLPSSTPTSRLLIILFADITSACTGILWNHTFPINKNLWTRSYVLFAASLSLSLLALFYWLIDVRGLNDNPAGKWLLRPWLIFGSNAITAFVVSNIFVELALWIKVPAGTLINPSNPAQRVSIWLWTYRDIFARHNSTEVTSLAFAIAFTALCFLPNWLLWRRKIFFKI